MNNPPKVGRFTSLCAVRKSGCPLQDYRKAFIQSIKTFARWAGIKQFPPTTCERLRRSNDYFIFCFSALISDPLSIITGRSEEGRRKKERYLKLLNNPALATKTDLFRGLQDFMGNFTLYMPGESHRVLFDRRPDLFLDKKKIFDLIDLHLSQNGMKAREEKLRSAANSEEPVIVPSALKRGQTSPEKFDKRIAYFKFCLEIFELLVEKHHINPKDLWH